MRKVLLASAACLAMVSGLASKAASNFKAKSLAQTETESQGLDFLNNFKLGSGKSTHGGTTEGGLIYDYGCEARE